MSCRGAWVTLGKLPVADSLRELENTPVVNSYQDR